MGHHGYALAFGSLLLFGGKLGDVLGRRITFIVGLTSLTIGAAPGGRLPADPYQPHQRLSDAPQLGRGQLPPHLRPVIERQQATAAVHPDRLPDDST